MNDSMIEVQGLSKKYTISHIKGRSDFRDIMIDMFKKKKKREEFWALKDITFTVEDGDILGIIGHNGAGKTTLLKVLSKITYPTNGYAKLKGRVSSLLEVGTGFHSELTGGENIFLNGSILGMKRNEIREKYDEIVEFSGVERFLDTPVKRYSSGMYVRLAFSVAAHLESEILLIDEVLAVGDVEFQKKCLGKMKEVTETGRTILFVSHNMNAIENLCNSALLLENGKIRNISDDVHSIIREYRQTQGDLKESSFWINHSGDLFSNPWFKPIKFMLTDDKGNKLTMPVCNDSEIWVQIEGEISDLEPALTVGYAIYTEDDLLLFWSYHTDEKRERWPKLKIGYNILRSKIPKRFLNQNNYRVELIGGLHFRQWLFKPRVSSPSLYLSIQGGLSDSEYWMTKRPGVIAPVMSWELKA